MLGLKDLNALQSHQSQLSLDRKSRSAALCQKGNQSLGLAAAGQFQDKNMLMAASDAFGQAIGYDRKNPEGYLGMAQILFLLQDYSEMNKYLTELELLQPDHPAILDLRQLSKNVTAPIETVSAIPESSLTMEDLSLQLLNYVKEISNQPISTQKLVVEKDAQSELRQMLQQRQQQLQQLENNLEKLDNLMDTLPLRQRMYPIQRYVKQLESHLKTSNKGRELLLTCQQGVKQVALIMARLPEIQHEDELPPLEKALEFLTDSCDQVADQLDELDRQGFQILPVSLHYQRWVLEIEHAFDAFDGRQDDLKQTIAQGVPHAH